MKDGEAEWYKGVTVTYIHGRQAVMTVYDDGTEKEKITLSDLKTKNEMHAMMSEKGFVKKSEEEIAEHNRKLEQERAAEEERVRKLKEERRMQAEERRKRREEELEAKRKMEEEAKEKEKAESEL